MVRLLLARQGVEVNKSAADGATALYLASQNGRLPGQRLSGAFHILFLEWNILAAMLIICGSQLVYQQVVVSTK